MGNGTGGSTADARPALAAPHPAAVRPGDLVELVRLPAVLSVPGDALLGAATSGCPRGGRLAAPAALLYLAGMALNDWADRVEDALERPGRPVPSGRVPAATARRLATALTAGGLAGAAALGGRAGLLRAVPLAAAVWAYDLGGKRGPAGPALMAACRALDVGLGSAGGRWAGAVPYAAVVAAHTATVAQVSRHETTGGDARLPRRAARRTLALAGVTAVGALVRGGQRPADAGAPAVALVLLARYAADVGGGFRRAAADPTPAALQAAVGDAVAGLVPLQAALLAAAGALPAAALLVTAPSLVRPLAEGLARQRSVS